jgi:cell division protein FtsB
MKLALCLPTLLLFTAMSFFAQNELRTRAEISNYEETSRYEEVRQFFGELQKRSKFMRLETFGKTQEGRELPLAVLSNPLLADPAAARKAGRPVVFIMANIHGGEVEGKEAAQVLARRLLTGDLQPLLKKLVILIAPIYNADGNEKINAQNRTAQYGPVAGVGARENAKGLDLNRDYMKLESPEANSLVGLMNRWDPHLTVDLHTTNGSFHGYHLTYSIPLNPSTDNNIAAFHRDRMMPALAQSMLAQHNFRTYYYGNFTAPAPKAGEPDRRAWQAFTHQPRIGQNYVGLRNRLTILSEAYSYLSFKRRIEVTEAFVEEIFKYAAVNAKAILNVTKQADQAAAKRANGQLGVEYKNDPLPKPVEILVGEVNKVRNERNGKDMLAMPEDKFTPVSMQDLGLFTATRSVAMPRGYLVRREAGGEIVWEKLRAHGIVTEELTAPLNVEVASFIINEIKRAPRPFQGHNEIRLRGEYKKETQTFPAGSVFVRTAQPLGTLAAYLLEPESDDGLVAWNFLDSYLAVGKPAPVYKLMNETKIASRRL